MPAVSRETAHQIDQIAACWATRVDRGLSEDEERDLDRWLASDVRHLGAYGRMRAVSFHMDRARAFGPRFDRAHFIDKINPAITRRRLVVGAGGVAAAAAAGLALHQGAGLSSMTRYRTIVGEVSIVPLADGSVMTLNTASKAQITFSRTLRLVRLVEGEALFDVAKDAKRPFLVEAGDLIVRAVGTSFSVLRLPGAPVEVIVREGAVELDGSARKTRKAPVQLAANTRAVLSPSAPALVSSTPLPPTEIGRELAWREGRLAFAGETLQEAVEKFARYSTTRIIIADPTIAVEPITGLFQANDPVGFAQTIAASFDLRTHISQGEIRLER